MVIIDGDKDLIHKMVIRIDDTPLKFKHGSPANQWLEKSIPFGENHQIFSVHVGCNHQLYTPEDERLEHVLMEAWFRSFSLLNG